MVQDISSGEHNLVNIEPGNQPKELCYMSKIWLFSFFQTGGFLLERKLILNVSSDSPMVGKMCESAIRKIQT